MGEIISNQKTIYYYEPDAPLQELAAELAIKGLSVAADNFTIKAELVCNIPLSDYQIYFEYDGKRHRAQQTDEENIAYTFQLESREPIVFSVMLDVGYGSIYLPFKCKTKEKGGISREIQGTRYTIGRITKKKIEISQVIIREKTKKEQLKNWLIQKGVLQ